jgi:hypothetical protein
MDKLQRAKGGIRKFLKSGRSSNEEDGKESSSQASISVDTKLERQNAGEVASTAAKSSQELAYEKREMAASLE